MENKFQNLDAFYEEELFAIVESIFSEFLIELLEKKEYSRFRDFLLKSSEKRTLPGNAIMNNRRPSKTMIAAEKVSKVKQYVEEYYGRSISLGDVSGIVGLSEAAFSHFFKKNTGQSFITYLNEFRTEKASRLLQETEELVIEIGYITGFNTPCHFNEVFKQHRGMTPGEFRKLCRRNL